MSEPQEFHWYCFAFSLTRGFANGYLGLNSTVIQRKDILEAKEYAAPGCDAALMAATYLGYMTKEKFLEGCNSQG